MLLAAWRLSGAPDLDDDSAPPPAAGRQSRAGASCGAAPVRDLAFVAFLAALLALGLKRPFLFVLAYAYVDIVSPQRLSYSAAQLASRSRMIMAALALAAWFFVDDKRHFAVDAATMADAVAARLLRAHHLPCRRARSRPGSNGTGRGRRSPSRIFLPLHAAHQAQDRGLPPVHDPVGGRDHHRRRHQDGAVGRRLWRAEPDGRQQ